MMVRILSHRLTHYPITGAASKGSILQMCPPAERTDALSAITLIELIARLITSMS